MEWEEIGHQLSGGGALRSPFTEVLTSNPGRTASTANCVILRSRLKTSSGVYLRAEEGRNTVSTYYRPRTANSDLARSRPHLIDKKGEAEITQPTALCTYVTDAYTAREAFVTLSRVPRGAEGHC